jgi:hypothetical protein
MNNQSFSSPHWRAIARRHPSAFLLAAQLASLVLYAAFDEIAYGRALLGALGVLVLALTVWVVTRTPAINWIAWVLVAPAFVLSLLSADYRVTIDELFAAGATFTLIAWGFAYMYLICQIWFPESFTGMTHPGQPRTFLELLFLSFTTLSATGLGDILPIGSAARVLVMLEQFAGIAYLAVVVSRLIGMTIVRHKLDIE